MADHVSRQQLSYEKWLEIVQPQITKHVQQNFAHYFPQLAGQQPLSVVMVKAPRHKRYTVIFDLAVQANNGRCVKRLIAKAYHLMPGRGPKELDLAHKSRHEFEMHQKVFDCFRTQEEEFHIVKPLDYIPELLCLIIERAEGRDLGSLIQSVKHSSWHFEENKEKLGAHFRRAGKWLALFHSGFASNTDTYFEPTHFEEQMQRYWNRIASAHVSAQDLNSMQSRLRSLLQVFAGAPLPQAQLHGDLKPCHIFVTENTLFPLDFGNTLVGVTYYDVAQMLVECKLFDLGVALPMHSHLINYLQRQFIQGYFGEKRWQPLLRFYYILWLCAKWDRRLRKHKWMLHPFAKKIDTLIRTTTVRDFVNRKYFTPWFHKVLMRELDILERKIAKFDSSPQSQEVKHESSPCLSARC
ncbi:MAG: aminoglycoside phosphotransferase family protein [candidate division KSB1 bacterium]|nr:aminoglycoside phosphotransferase family protein [candidate division KSB1 bacterium]MDZ7302275.1 aminoglycoside phosphotransferase family protein [candidate division KSB1 bacterium]MDZ7311381.1 aminoglycoside phosphotransferase family protein [candidate division KSB1 bacterium]